MSEDASPRRVTIRQAAERLGITEGAVRKRIQRGSISYDKDEDGRVYVYLDTYEDMSQDATSHSHSDAAPAELVDVLQDQVLYLREQLAEEREARRRADTIIAQLGSSNARLGDRLAELEGASGEPEKPQEAREESGQGSTPGDTPEGAESGTQRRESQPRSWWRRLFGN